MSNDTGSVPDPLIQKLVSYIVRYLCNNFLSYTLHRIFSSKL